MTERPILFSAPMVRAILEGRKTQTRRVVKTFSLPGQDNCVRLATGGYATLQDSGLGYHPHAGSGWKLLPPDRINIWNPYGKPGDQLWVRETTIVHGSIREQLVGYVADGTKRTEGWEIQVPSIYMRRMHSRITLEITDVRVQRLLEISEEDAKAEGTERITTTECGNDVWMDYGDPKSGKGFLHAGYSYKTLWESINGEGSWDANPWVWAITFRRVTDGSSK